MITSFFKKKRKADDAEKDEAASAGPSTPATACSSSDKEEEEASSSSSKKPKQHVEASSPVKDLLACLDGSIEEEFSWRKALDKHFSSKRFETLAKFVASQR